MLTDLYPGRQGNEEKREMFLRKEDKVLKSRVVIEVRHVSEGRRGG